MTRKTDKVTKAGAVELSEDALDHASGGGSTAYIKMARLEDTGRQAVREVKLTPTITPANFTANPVKL